MNVRLARALWAVLASCAAVGVGVGNVAADAIEVRNYLIGNSAGDSHPVTFSSALAPAGSGIIAVGAFDATDAEISGSIGSFASMAAMVARFNQFGTSSTFGTGAGAAPGFPGLFAVAPSGSWEPDSAFSGRPMYVVLGNGAALDISTQIVVLKTTQKFTAVGTTGGPTIPISITGTSEFIILIGTLGSELVYYNTGPLANKSLRPLVARYPWPEEDPYFFWIAQYFPGVDSRANRTADPDQDELTNGEEYIAGTVPNDFDSSCRILSIEFLTPDMLIVIWSTVPGRRYRLAASEDGRYFQSLGDNQTAFGSTMGQILNDVRAPTRLFKVLVQQ